MNTVAGASGRSHVAAVQGVSIAGKPPPIRAWGVDVAVALVEVVRRQSGGADEEHVTAVRRDVDDVRFAARSPAGDQVQAVVVVAT